MGSWRTFPRGTEIGSVTKTDDPDVALRQSYEHKLEEIVIVTSVRTGVFQSLWEYAVLIDSIANTQQGELTIAKGSVKSWRNAGPQSGDKVMQVYERERYDITV